MAKTLLPTDATATKLRNAVVKAAGGEAAKRFFDSNPYSSTQELQARGVDLSKLEEICIAEGWKRNDNHYNNEQHRIYVSQDDNLHVIFNLGSKDGYVRVLGPKKAKRSSLPYYD